ncbi:MAG TPA: O-antigen ligase family protein [Propionibacteriaceae bacterium]|nr:O-antigen ligase family protein [Propionibacteriaceae bacterium]
MTFTTRSGRLSAFLLTALVALGVLTLGMLPALWPAGAVLSCAALFVILSFCLPAWTLPSLSLVLFALVPVGYLAMVPEVLGRFVTPSVVLMTCWLLRVRLGRTRWSRRGALWLLSLAGLLVALSLCSITIWRSLLWSAVFTVAALLPAAWHQAAGYRTRAALTRTWLLLGAGLGALALVEGVARRNPLSMLYTVEQHWSVYRVETTIGHPLLNGTFFAVTACIAFFSIRSEGRNGLLPLAVFALCSAGATLSGSRSAVYALIAGLGVGVMVLLLSRRAGLGLKLLALSVTVVTVAVVPNVPIITTRASSAEAGRSTQYRDMVVQLATELFAKHPYIGTGPGSSGTAAANTDTPLTIESAVLGTLVSTGIIGSAALAIFLLTICVRAARSGSPGCVAALAAFVVTGSAYPLWESNPAAWVLVGWISLLATAPMPRRVDPAIGPPALLSAGVAEPARPLAPTGGRPQ